MLGAAIFGVRSYGTIEAIPASSELALVMVPADGVSDAIRACAARGVGAFGVFANGIADVGEALRVAAPRTKLRTLIVRTPRIRATCSGRCSPAET